MKRLLSLILLPALLLSGCTLRQEEKQLKQYTASFLTLFDTLTTVVGRRESEEAFRSDAEAVRDGLEKYHRLFDIYSEYEGVNNLKTINDNAGIAPVEVDGEVIALLKDCRAYYEESGGRVNAAMGGVLGLWHDARSYGLDNPDKAYLPDVDALKAAAEHADFDCVVIDEAASTVFITDAGLRLDVGALAKGWAVQRVAEKAPEGLLISVGGNVCATGPKDKDGAPWVVGIRNPDGGAEDYLHTVFLSRGSVVTSGDYQRAYAVDGEVYHHIIDPETLYPAKHWRAVTIVCPDSGDADMLSTALFLMDMEKGSALLEKYDACALWVGPDGEMHYSPGFEELIRT